MNVNKKFRKEICLTIADITIKVVDNGLPPEVGGFKLDSDSSYIPFLSKKKSDIVFRVNYDSLQNISLGEKLFESGGVWDLYKNNNCKEKYIYTFSSHIYGAKPYKIVEISKDFKDGDIYVRTKDQLPIPMAYPLDELMFVNYLSQGIGLEVHSCGVIDNNEGLLFLGVSGAGKSTMSNLWKGQPEVTLLSDDRMIIRKKDGEFWMYGTPWHGDAGVSSQGCAPIKRIFFIEKSPKNYQKELSPKEAFGRILVRCFPTFWNSKGMEFVMDFSSELCGKISCCELGFFPDHSVIDFIRKKTKVKNG